MVREDDWLSCGCLLLHRDVVIKAEATRQEDKRLKAKAEAKRQQEVLLLQQQKADADAERQENERLEAKAQAKAKNENKETELKAGMTACVRCMYITYLKLQPNSTGLKRYWNCDQKSKANQRGNKET